MKIGDKVTVVWWNQEEIRVPGIVIDERDDPTEYLIRFTFNDQVIESWYFNGCCLEESEPKNENR